MATQGEREFTAKISNIVNHGFLTVGLGIGRELGLFTAMADIDRPATSAEVATKAGCKERPVREWLHQMAVGGIIDVDQAGSLFFLPPERRAGLQSMFTYFAMMLPYSLTSHVPVMSVFKADGPLGLSPEHVSAIFYAWRSFRTRDWVKLPREAISSVEGLHEQLVSGIKVVDIGTGTGHFCHWLAAEYPQSKVIGLDINPEDIERARSIATKERLTNVTFEVHDVCNLPAEWTDHFDLVFMFDVLHDVPRASQAVPEVHRILKKDAWFLLVDIYVHSHPKDNVDNPFAVPLYAFSIYSCLTGSMYTPGSEALGSCVGIETLRGLLEKGGFDVNYRSTIKKLGDFNVLFPCQK